MRHRQRFNTWRLLERKASKKLEMYEERIKANQELLKESGLKPDERTEIRECIKRFAMWAEEARSSLFKAMAERRFHGNEKSRLDVSENKIKYKKLTISPRCELKLWKLQNKVRRTIFHWIFFQLIHIQSTKNGFISLKIQRWIKREEELRHENECPSESDDDEDTLYSVFNESILSDPDDEETLGSGDGADPDFRIWRQHQWRSIRYKLHSETANSAFRVMFVHRCFISGLWLGFFELWISCLFS